MVRILQVVTHMNRGGLETMLMNYYRQIDRSRVQFDFLVHRAERGDYDDEIESLGGRIYRLPRLNPLSPSYARALKDFFQTHAYSIVHSHLDCMSAYPLCAAKKAGVPVRIAHAHSKSQDKDWKYLIKLYAKSQIPKYATDLFACGNEAGAWMFHGQQQIKLLPNAIETDLYTFDPEIRNQVRAEFQLQNQPVIGHVGRFNYPKNHPFLIHIFAKLVQLIPDARLMLVGGGEGMDEIKAKVHTLGLTDQVIFTGVRSDVDRLMQAMDLFVMPSLYEGLPVTMVEAQAAGLPCLISDKVPAECIITDGLVSIERLESAADVWAQRIMSQLRSTKRSSHREEIISHGFDITSAANCLEEFYLEKCRK